MATTAPTGTRVPPAVFVLAASIFCLGTTEFMIAGLLPTIAGDLGVSIPSAGLLISGFAIGMAVGTPLMTAATLRLPRRATLLASLLVFVLGHVLAALATTYGVLMTARIITAVACGTFWAAAAVVSVALAPAGARAKALAVLLGGLTVSNVVGVPLGALVGQQLGWRAAFWAVAVLASVSAVGVAMVAPRARGVAAPAALRHELRTFASSRVWVALATIAVFQAAVFAVFSYVAPLLTDHAGWPVSRVPVVLALFGLGSLLGIVLGGKVADRNLFLNLYAGLATLSLVLAALALVAHSGTAATVAIRGDGHHRVLGGSCDQRPGVRRRWRRPDARELGHDVGVQRRKHGGAVDRRHGDRCRAGVRGTGLAGCGPGPAGTRPGRDGGHPRRK